MSKSTHSDAELAVTVMTSVTETPIEQDLNRFELERRTERFTCASGDRFGGEWRGVPLSELLPPVVLPGETTHLIFETVDGLRVCLPVMDALDGLLAVADSDGFIDSAPRLIASCIDGPRAAKRVTHIEPIVVAPEESPDEFENLL